MNNKDLKDKYDEMHKAGPESWFSQGYEERLAILQSGWPWAGLDVLEIGCGEGDLAAMMQASGADVIGIDYSEEGMTKLAQKYPSLMACRTDYRNFKSPVACYDRIVLQGLLEHLDDSFKELKWMIDNLLKEHGEIITSSSNFLNPRGIVWMTLASLFNVPMSLTDLHFLHPEQFAKFADENGYKMTFQSCDISWGWGKDMIEDFKTRLPKALSDVKMNTLGVPKLLKWLESNINIMLPIGNLAGATVVYRIKT